MTLIVVYNCNINRNIYTQYVLSICFNYCVVSFPLLRTVYNRIPWRGGILQIKQYKIVKHSYWPQLWWWVGWQNTIKIRSYANIKNCEKEMLCK